MFEEHKNTELLHPERISAEELDKAFDSVATKLQKLFATLEDDEKAAFTELINSVGDHTDTVQARDEGDINKILYCKPIQVHATLAMKQKMQQLPNLILQSKSS